jgi:hypothetical protein
LSPLHCNRCVAKAEKRGAGWVSASMDMCVSRGFWRVRLDAENHEFSGQAKKGARGMPRHGQAMKGVVSCDKHRGAARRQ